VARIRDKQTGDKIGTKNQTAIHTNDLIVSRIDACNGAMTIVPSELVSGLFRTRSGSAHAPTLIFWEGTVHPRLGILSAIFDIEYIGLLVRERQRAVARAADN